MKGCSNVVRSCADNAKLANGSCILIIEHIVQW